MTKHKNSEIVSILEEARTAASEITEPTEKANALVVVAQAYFGLTRTNRSGNLLEDSQDEEEVVPQVG